ncbi:GPN-loop GTPase 3 [Leptopilina heterotoma]|uniref:GPN-loop GTPase 3 n=1 Tax=Leptopilina heterotoma TaxID=63436 RepID=UPI001CA93A24|nr:GPN-loop GTPase 3 [Leptopilina heterotoma]
MRYGQIVIGPAGCGKSTFCSVMQRQAADDNKIIEIVNLDPAADYFEYTPFVDIRELIHVDDTMEDEELKFGPNGGLVYCMEYLMEHIEWLEEQLGDTDDDYILFDCPGQIELYTHMSEMQQLILTLQKMNFHLCSVFVLDSQFMVDGPKFMSGTMSALSTMINLELPHINIVTKMDLLSKSAKKQLDKFLEPDPHSLLAEMKDDPWNEKYKNLTNALGALIENYSLVKFYPLNIKDEESIGDIKITIDNIIQYGEEEDVKTKDFDEPDEEDDKD